MGTPQQPIDTGRHACTVGLKSLFKIINERSPEGREARKFFEQTKTSIQCKKVLTSKDHCWLCGNMFGHPEPQLAPQCEHVLPIAQGVIFLELYSTKKGDITEAMELEYEWAHAICNNLKNATVLISGDERGFSPDVDKINELIQTIKSKGIPIPDNQLLSVQGRLFEVTEYINKLPDFSINYSGLCPRKLVFKGGRKKSAKRTSKLKRTRT